MTFRRINRAAAVVAEHQNEWCSKHCHGIFQAGDHLVAGKISGHAAHEEIAPAANESVLGRNARISAAQNGCVGVMPSRQCFPFVLEIVPQRHFLHISRVSFEQAVQGGIRREHVLRLGEFSFPSHQPCPPGEVPLRKSRIGRGRAVTRKTDQLNFADTSRRFRPAFDSWFASRLSLCNRLLARRRWRDCFGTIDQYQKGGCYKCR